MTAAAWQGTRCTHDGCGLAGASVLGWVGGYFGLKPVPAKKKKEAPLVGGASLRAVDWIN